MNKPTYLFHYTSGARVNDIINSKELIISKAGLLPGEKPTLWLSSEPNWDDSARKFHNFKDKHEQHKAIGLGRIVVPFFDHFVTYAKWKHVSGAYAFQVALEEVMFPNYDRKKWWASFKNISQDEFLSIEIWNGKQWCLYNSNTPSKYNCLFINNNL